MANMIPCVIQMRVGISLAWGVSCLHLFWSLILIAEILWLIFRTSIHHAEIIALPRAPGPLTFRSRPIIKTHFFTIDIFTQQADIEFNCLIVRLFILDSRVFDFIIGIISQESEECFTSIFVSHNVFDKSVVKVLCFQHFLHLAQSVVPNYALFITLLFLKPRNEDLHNVFDNIFFVLLLNFSVFLDIFAEDPNFFHILAHIFLLLGDGGNYSRAIHFIGIDVDFKLIFNSDKFIFVDDLSDLI